VAFLLGLILSVSIVLVATAVYTLLLWWADRYEKEPGWMLAMALLWGAIPAAIASLILEVLFDARVTLPGSLLSQIVSSGLVGPAIEEAAKGLMLLVLYRWQRLEFDGVVDGIVYGALIGFGFAMTENLLYFLGALVDGGLGAWLLVVILRQFIFGLNHAFFTSLTGIGFGLARLSNRRWRAVYPILGLFVAIAFHAVHNTSIALAGVRFVAFLVTLVSDLGGVLLVFAVLFLAVRREAAWVVEELADEVGNTLTADDYAQLQNYRSRVRGIVPRRGRERRLQQRIHRLATELALKKHQLRRAGDEQGVRLRIAQLRAQLISAQEEREKARET